MRKKEGQVDRNSQKAEDMASNGLNRQAAYVSRLLFTN